MLAKGSPRPWPRAVALAVRRGLQRWMTSALEQARPGDAEERMRAKLARWHLPGFPRLVAGRVLGRLRDLAGRVPPRVQAAVLGSLFNRWATGRRFQSRYEGGCLLGCGGDDSIEHYLRCRIGRDFCRDCIFLDISAADTWDTMMLASCPSRYADHYLLWVRIAILHYVLYRSVHALRHCPQSPEHIRRVLQQALVEAVRGHPAAQQVLRVTRRQ